MKEDISYLRKTYKRGEVFFSTLKNPFNLFKSWFNEAKEDKLIDEVNAMTLSTIGIDDFPKGRVVLLKEYGLDGFIFYSNYDSEKGISIKKNTKVSLSFFWPSQERQIIIKGNAEKTSSKASDKYFSSRPKKSQIAAILSKQSHHLSSYNELVAKMSLLEKKYQNISPKRPVNWGGYRVEPGQFEFWQGRPNRLHQRFLFYLENSKWSSKILSP